MKIYEALSYDDVLLTPQYSEIVSRRDVDVSIVIGVENKIKLSVPIIASPMDTVSGAEMLNAMADYGSIGVMHRYNSISQQQQIITDVVKKDFGVAVGMTGDYKERVSTMVKSGAKIICIDVAHGHHNLMEDVIKWIKKYYPNVHIMAGNVATASGYAYLSGLGVDSVRVGIGGGSICSTRVQTGHGVPTFQSIVDCKEYKPIDNGASIIADGGIRNSGDIVKAVAAGADCVMVGSLLASTVEAPGKVYTENGVTYKVYRGMASFEAQKSNLGKTSMAPEGIVSRVPFAGKYVKDVLSELEGGIRSGLSYSGAPDIKTLQKCAKFVKQTSAGQTESSTHILKR